MRAKVRRFRSRMSTASERKVVFVIRLREEEGNDIKKFFTGSK